MGRGLTILAITRAERAKRVGAPVHGAERRKRRRVHCRVIRLQVRRPQEHRLV